MRATALGLVVGACCLQASATLPVLHLSVAALGGAGLLLLLAARLPRLLTCLMPGLGRVAAHALVSSLMLLAGLLAGYAWSALLAQERLAQSLPAALEGKDLVLTGVVESLPARFERGTRFLFRVEQAQAGVPRRIALSWYEGEDGGVKLAEILPGERWRLQVRLRRPHGNANPWGFDYEAWLLEQDVRATGYVRPAPAINQRLQAFVPGMRVTVERMRDWLRTRMQSALQGRPYAGILVALVIGDQRDISPADWRMFTATGVGHLVSISGLHITMVAGLFASLAMFMWRHSFFTAAQLPLVLPAQKVAALSGAGCALLYVALSGFGVPAQRTLYMLCVVAWALWSARAAMVSHVLCAALALVVVLDPWAVLWPGFWLSFGAVAVILFAEVGQAAQLAGRGGWRDHLRGAIRTQWAVSVGLVPLSLLLFSQVSLVSPLANALAIPVISLVVTPLALLGSVMPEPLPGWTLGLAHQLLAWLAVFLQWLAALPAATFSAPTPAWWMFALALAGTLWLLAPPAWPHRAAGVLLWLPLLFNPATAPTQGFVLTAFDVGQGMAVLVETARHRLLYDSGPWYTPEADGGNRVILPYLKARGIGSLDTLVISHQDNDHSGGALSLLTQLPVGTTFSSLDWKSPLVAAASNHVRCVAGQRWDWDGVRFEMLHPDGDSYSQAGRPNARSCTLKVSYGSHAALLPGDIEAAQEAQLLTRVAGRLPADILLAPHHGSGTSSTPDFLEAVDPKLAIFQVGYRNRYHHPKAEVYARYGSLGIRRLRSDEAGAVQVTVGEGLQVAAWREQAPRYWQGR